MLPREQSPTREQSGQQYDGKTWMHEVYTTNLFCRADNQSFINTDLTPKVVKHKVTKQRGNKEN